MHLAAQKLTWHTIFNNNFLTNKLQYNCLKHLLHTLKTQQKLRKHRVVADANHFTGTYIVQCLKADRLRLAQHSQQCIRQQAGTTQALYLMWLWILFLQTTSSICELFAAYRVASNAIMANNNENSQPKFLQKIYTEQNL